MKHKIGDLFAKTNIFTLDIVICVTTNGTVNKKTGELVMGKGVALRAKQIMPELPKYWGALIANNSVSGCIQELPTTQIFDHSEELTIWMQGTIREKFYAFQTKTKWWESSSYKLIKNSTETLRTVALLHPEKTFLLPIPGCGNGGLDPNVVVPMLFSLPDNVVLVTEKPLEEILNHSTNSSMSIQPYHD